MLVKSKNKIVALSIVLFFSVSVVALCFNASISPNQTTNKLNSNINNNSQTSAVTPESSYLPLNRNGVQPVGNITVLAINSMGWGQAEYSGTLMQLFNITYTYLGYTFMGVQKVASINNRDNSTDMSYVTIRVNQTAQYNYWYNDSNTLTVFKSNLSPNVLQAVYLNGTSLNMSLISYTDDGGIMYNFSSYYQNNNNGSLIMNYIIDYNLTIANWNLKQYDSGVYPYIQNQSQIVGGAYNYTFTPGLSDLNITAKFLINLPDAPYLYNFSMGTYSGSSVLGSSFTSYQRSNNNSINVTTSVNATRYSINFAANFTVSFVNHHGGLWSRDALYENQNIRQRQYDLSVTAGPSSILVSYFRFNISTIPYPDMISTTSAFGRPLTTMDMNTTAPVVNATTTENESTPVGTTVLFISSGSALYYLQRNEIDVITITYRANQMLNILLVDKTQIPVNGAVIHLYYDNVSFGTVMSNAQTLEYPLQTTNFQGQIIISNLPRGNYTIAIYYHGQFIQNSTVDTSSSLNYINTSIPHFPTWILIFAGISIIFVIAGFYYYRKNR